MSQQYDSGEDFNQDPEAPHELEISRASSRSVAEIQAAMVVAKRFPRNEEASFTRLMKACDRFNFADAAAYAFKRGTALVTGPSAPLAREAMRIWGNTRSGLHVVRESKETRLIRGWAWDLETNTYQEAEDEFSKLVQRKVKDAQGRVTSATEWVEPDERDLRELTNRRGAILVRNCQLVILPKDFIEDALKRAEQTIKNGAKIDPDGWKKIVEAFADLNVPIEQLATYLGHAVKESSPPELVALRAIFKSIADGNSTWSEYHTPNGGQDEDLASKSQDKMQDVKDRYAPRRPADVTVPEAAKETQPAPLTQAERKTALDEAVAKVDRLREEMGLPKTQPVPQETPAATGTDQPTASTEENRSSESSASSSKKAKNKGEPSGQPLDFEGKK